MSDMQYEAVENDVDDEKASERPKVRRQTGRGEELAVGTTVDPDEDEDAAESEESVDTVEAEAATAVEAEVEDEGAGVGVGRPEPAPLDDAEDAGVADDVTPGVDEGESVSKEDAEAPESADEGAGGSLQRSDLPLLFRRDEVKDQRKNLQVMVQDDTQDRIREMRFEMEKEFGSAYKLDVYEAVMRAGLQCPEMVEAELEEWGYGLE